MIESKFRDPNFLESLGIKFESNQCISPDWSELEFQWITNGGSWMNYLEVHLKAFSHITVSIIYSAQLI